MKKREEIEEAIGKKRGVSGTYTTSFEENLIDKSTADIIREQLTQGSGSELNGEKPKFQSIGSSSALAANTFMPWLSQLDNLRIGELTGFKGIQLEKKMPTGLGGTPPNLDVYLERDFSEVYIESKFLEPLSGKRASFSESYRKIDDIRKSSKWYQLYEHISKDPSDYWHLDVAQLVKHFFGITNPKQRKQHSVLFYLFWEPKNPEKIDAFMKHREEIKLLEEFVADDPLIEFWTMSYQTLWSEWEALGEWAASLVQKLRSWYELSV